MADATSVVKRRAVGAAEDRQRLGPGRPRGGRRQVEHEPAEALRRAQVDLEPLREARCPCSPSRCWCCRRPRWPGTYVWVYPLADGRLVQRQVGGRGAAPVPDSATVVGLFVALLVTVRLPVRVPDAVGVNVTLTVQEPPAAIDVPQLLVCAKSPVAATLETDAAAVPVLVTVTVWAALVVLSAWLGRSATTGWPTGSPTNRRRRRRGRPRSPRAGRPASRCSR